MIAIWNMLLKVLSNFSLRKSLGFLLLFNIALVMVVVKYPMYVYNYIYS